MTSLLGQARSSSRWCNQGQPLPDVRIGLRECQGAFRCQDAVHVLPAPGQSTCFSTLMLLLCAHMFDVSTQGTRNQPYLVLRVSCTETRKVNGENTYISWSSIVGEKSITDKTEAQSVYARHPRVSAPVGLSVLAVTVSERRFSRSAPWSAKRARSPGVAHDDRANHRHMLPSLADDSPLRSSKRTIASSHVTPSQNLLSRMHLVCNAHCICEPSSSSSHLSTAFSNCLCLAQSQRRQVHSRRRGVAHDHSIYSCSSRNTIEGTAEQALSSLAELGRLQTPVVGAARTWTKERARAL